MEDENLLLLLLLLKKKKLVLKRLRGESTPKREYWVHPISLRRHELGVYHTLVQEMRLYNNRHTKYLRMGPESFDFILNKITPLIEKQDTNMRKSLEPGLKLAVTLHHLAEGASHRTIADHYRLGRSTVSEIIYATCNAIWETMQPEFMKPPAGPGDMKEIAKGYVDLHCIMHFITSQL